MKHRSTVTREHGEVWTQKSVRDSLRAMPDPESPSAQRLTVDLPITMHRTLKASAAMQGVTMVELIRLLLADVLADPKRFDQTAAKARQVRTNVARGAR